MLSSDTLAREASFIICGRDYTFPRSLDMLRRAESAVGPVAPFAQRLDARACRSEEIARLYGAFLRDVAGAPTQKEIDAWVFDRGLLHRDLAVFLYSLTLGSDEIEAVSKSRGLNAQPSPAGEPQRGPFAPTEAPIGITSSASHDASVGPPPRRGPVLFTR